MEIAQLKPAVVVRGPLLSEPVQIITTLQIGESVKLVGKGLETGRVHEPILSPEQVSMLDASPEIESFDGDAGRFRLGVEALRLALAYEYDPYFSLSIARVDPLPHQLEAVYDYFLSLPRIRFLLADDPGAGKTIMAGLLLKELKIRGLVKRTLIVTPANLSFQWQREMREKFRENFEVLRGEILQVERSFRSTESLGGPEIIAKHIDATITITVAPWVSSRTVTRAYRKAQTQTMGSSGGKPPGLKHLTLFRFVVGEVELSNERTTQEGSASAHGDIRMPEGKRLLSEWKKAYPQWAKTEKGDLITTRRFWRDFHRIKKTIALGPPYRRGRTANDRR